MRWTKLGKIFDPTSHSLANGCREFAQAPQALVRDGYIRLYFSTRQRDGSTGKYLSHIAYADFDNTLRNVIGVSQHTIIPLGDRGTFDEHGIFPISPVERDNHILAFTCGWSRRVSVSVETAVGLAISSDDGRTFKKVGNGPVMGPSLREPCLVGDAFVRVYEGVFHMWYIFGTGWKIYASGTAPDRIYKIAHAVSTDGKSWAREGQPIIPDVSGSEECQALPTVLKIGNRYHMYFCYRQPSDFRKNKDRAYRLGYAFSDDLKSWTRADTQAGIGVSEQGWDSEMMCYPHIFQSAANVYLLYNGNEFGRHGFGLAILDQE